MNQLGIDNTLKQIRLFFKYLTEIPKYLDV